MCISFLSFSTWSWPSAWNGGFKRLPGALETSQPPGRSGKGADRSQSQCFLSGVDLDEVASLFPKRDDLILSLPWNPPTVTVTWLYEFLSPAESGGHGWEFGGWASCSSGCHWGPRVAPPAWTIEGQLLMSWRIQHREAFFRGRPQGCWNLLFPPLLWHHFI